MNLKDSFGIIPGGSMSLRGNVLIFLLCRKKNIQMYIKSTHRLVNIRDVRDIVQVKNRKERKKLTMKKAKRVIKICIITVVILMIICRIIAFAGRKIVPKGDISVQKYDGFYHNEVSGDYNPTINLCIAICKALGKTLDELFWES